MKETLLFFSDCQFFAGCENMLVNFLQSDTLYNNYKIYFIYNESKEYEKGLNIRVKSTKYNKIPLVLLTQPKLLNKEKIPTSIKPLVYIMWGIYLFMFKYFSIIYNSIIIHRILKKIEIDVLHINNGGYPAAYSCYSMIIAAKVAGISHIVYVVNNLAAGYASPFRWLDLPLDMFVKYSVKKFVTGSDFAGLRLKKVLRLNKSQQVTIPNGIRYRNITVENKLFRKQNCIPDAQILISVVALLEKRKGHIFLLKALKMLKDVDPRKMPLTIIEGDGKEKQKLSKFILHNKMEQDIRIVPFMENIFNLINASDIIIVPSIEDEDFPNIVIEAMSLGKPIIGTNISGIPEQIEHEVSGFIVEPKSPEELKIAIVELINNEKKRESISMETKKRFNKNYLDSISVSRYFNLYKTIGES